LTAHPAEGPCYTRITVGTVHFAAVAGLLYVVSLHLQQGAGLTPFAAAGIMAPLSLGIIITSFRVRDHIQRLGRRLVLAGSVVTLLGVLGQLATIVAAPGLPVVLAVPLFVTGLGMGCCFGSLFSTALGGVNDQQAGSASGTLNALQQIANATGAALVSTMFLALATDAGDRDAATLSLIVIAVILALAAAITPLLPRHAAADHY
jgi:MFS family permease